MMTLHVNGRAMPSRPTCLVTGAGGLVGRHLVPALAAQWNVVAIARDASPAGVPVSPHIVTLQRDLAAPDFAEGLPSRIDAVVHLAQSRRFREFPDGAADVLAVNIAATERLARYAAGAGARHFVYASSGGVYAPSSVPFTEDAPIATPAQAGWYQASKLASEALVHAYRDLLVPVVLRPFFIYGAGQQRHMLIPRLCDTVKRGDAVQLAGDEGMHVSPTHAADAARCIVQSLTLTAPATINVRGPDTLSLRRICELLGAALGIAPRFTCSDTPGPDYVADATRMDALLGAAQCRFAAHLHTILPPGML
jgi:nucleoside-diphosphate-sugar epimerase